MTLFMDPRTTPETSEDTSEDTTPIEAMSPRPEKNSSSTSRLSERLSVTPTVLGALGLLGSTAYLVDAFGWAEVNPLPISIIGLAIVSGGLVARKYFAGGRGLIPVGVLTLLVVAVSAIVGPYVHDGTGDRVYNPQAFDELESEYVFGLGNFTVDLRDVEFPPGETSISVEFGVGHARVWVPADINVEIVGDLDMGKIDLLGQTKSGFGNDLTIESGASSAATVVLDIQARTGHVEVRHG